MIAKTTKGLTRKWIKTGKIRWEKGFWPDWEIEKGWVPLVDSLITDLLKLGSWDGTLSQCKQKFGGLRFYINCMKVDKAKGLTKEKADRSFKLISKAEMQSLKVCEICSGRSTTKVTFVTDHFGKHYKVSNQAEVSGWIMSLCNKCWKKEETKKMREQLERLK